jgi:hypothetical protein
MLFASRVFLMVQKDPRLVFSVASTGYFVQNLSELDFNYYDVSITVVKKFATGKGNTKKEEMVLPIYKRWGFEHSSDNVRDAFVLAQIAKALSGQVELTKFQKEALNKIS